MKKKKLFRKTKFFCDCCHKELTYPRTHFRKHLYCDVHCAIKDYEGSLKDLKRMRTNVGF